MIKESYLSSLGLTTQGPFSGMNGLNDGFVNPSAVINAVGAGLSTMSGVPINNSTQSSNQWFGWEDVFKKLTLDGFATTQSILSQRFGGPQPGQYFQSREGTAYALPQGANATLATFPGIQGTGLSLTTLILLIGGGVLIMKAAK